MGGRRRAALAAAAAAAAAAALLLAAQPEPDGELREAFVLEAVYRPGTGVAEVRFEDRTGGTEAVVLEVLGMAESFQRTHRGSSFVEEVAFGPPPRYGWPAHPVTLDIEHAELGPVWAKTEIRPEGEPRARLLLGRG